MPLGCFRLHGGCWVAADLAADRDATAVDAGIFPVRDLRAYLHGNWRLERRFEDLKRGGRGRFVGRARFVRKGESLAYVERGYLAMGPHTGVARQCYWFKFPAPGVAQVMFRDERPFHVLNLSGGLWRTSHLCVDDVYEGEFSACAAVQWCSTWHVTGPRKSLLISSDYRRSAPSSS